MTVVQLKKYNQHSLASCHLQEVRLADPGVLVALLGQRPTVTLSQDTDSLLGPSKTSIRQNKANSSQTQAY
jgi:hypothetical protein